MSKHRDPMEIFNLTRREILRYGAFGAAGLMLGKGMGVHAYSASQLPKPSGKAKAKSVIQLWMWGGPSHIDTFDPKPAAGSDYAGPLGTPVRGNADGIMVGELLPTLAKHSDKYSIIRSMTHDSNAHETAAYMVQTGFKAGDGIVHPGVGAVVSLRNGYEAGYKGLIPPYIVLTQLLGRFSEAGFLGTRGAPFATGGDPSAARFVVEGVVAEGITDQRQKDRRELLHNLDTLRTALKTDARIADLEQCEAQAYDLILGDAGKVFDLSQEKDEVRAKYGRTRFGQSCLLARRLVERGVPYIAVNFGGWDTHKQNFPSVRRLCTDLDRGMSALLEDLAASGLLQTTIVWWGGEFGRTPRVQWEEPWGGGRGHWGHVFSSVVAGGGFKGGQVVGASDAKGESVKDRPVYPTDLIGSIYDLLGIDTTAPLPHPQGLPIPALQAAWDGGKSGGRLKEIM